MLVSFGDHLASRKMFIFGVHPPIIDERFWILLYQILAFSKAVSSDKLVYSKDWSNET
jgi:hypothetical protein